MGIFRCTETERRAVSGIGDGLFNEEERALCGGVSKEVRRIRLVDLSASSKGFYSFFETIKGYCESTSSLRLSDSLLGDQGQ